MKRVLVLGANGFLGSILYSYLSRQPGIESFTAGRRATVGYETSHITVDFNLEADLQLVLRSRQFDAIVNVAGRVTGSVNDLFFANSAIPAAIAKAASPSTHIIHVGSAAEYGVPRNGNSLAENAVCDPVSIYGISKFAGSQALLKAIGLKVTILRLFNVLAVENSSNQVVGSFESRVQAFGGDFRGQQIQMGDLGAVRDFVSAEDFCAAVSALLAASDVVPILNVCSGTGRKVRDIIGMINNSFPIPFEILETGVGSTASVSNLPIIGDATLFQSVIGRAPRQVDDVLVANANRIRSAYTA